MLYNKKQERKRGDINMSHKKILKNILVLFFTIMIFTNSISYGNIYISKIDDPLSDINSWKPSPVGSETQLVQKASTVLGIINIIGIVSSVVILIIIGIKYMFGSIEEKAEYKSTIWTYILGAFLLFSATTIPNIIYHAMSGIF